MKKFCSKCGAGIPNDAIFCAKCGAKIAREDPTPNLKEPSFFSRLLKYAAIALGGFFLLVLAVGIMAGGGKGKDANPQTQTEQKAKKPTFGKPKDFWKAYEAELANYEAQLAYGKDERGAIGPHGENAKRVRVYIDTDFVSNEVDEVKLLVHNGDVGALINDFANGAEALVAMTSPTLTADEVRGVLDELHLTKNAKSAKRENVTKRGRVTYTFENGLEDHLGLTFTAEVK